MQSLLCTAILSKMIQLLPNETIEDLQCGGYRIITAKDGFRFGTDAVLLAHFAHFRAGARVADFGTGSGILPILICARNRLIEFDALEIEAQAAWRAKRGISLNALESCVRVHHMDVKDAKKVFGCACFDAVVANPPYGKVGEGPLPPDANSAIARFEIALTLEDLLQSSFDVLKNGGRLFLVHRPGRLLEILDVAREKHLCPRVVRLVYPTPQREPKLVLLEFEKNGTAALRWDKPFIIMDTSGRYSQEAAAIYGKEGLCGDENRDFGRYV